MSNEELERVLKRQAETIEALREQNEHLSELLEGRVAVEIEDLVCSWLPESTETVATEEPLLW